MRNHEHDRLYPPDADMPLLTIVPATVGPCEHRTIEDPPSGVACLTFLFIVDQFQKPRLGIGSKFLGYIAAHFFKETDSKGSND